MALKKHITKRSITLRPQAATVVQPKRASHWLPVSLALCI
jgi:hypothetical protein